MTSTPTRWRLTIGLGLIGSVVVALIVLAFLWPSKTSSPHNLPVGISGDAQTVAALQAAVGDAAPDTFDFVDAADRADAERQIRERETYGAIVLGGPGVAPAVLTAPAASAAATQLLTGVAAQLQAQLAQQIAAAGGDPSTVQVEVTPVVPLSKSDPSGTGLAAASFPLLLGGMAGGVLISILVVGVWRRVAAALVFAGASGVVLTLVLQPWFEFLQGDFWLNALAIGASILATAMLLIGCVALLGRAGIALGAIVSMFVGNPLSAAAVPWQFLAAPWGAIGQYFVPGASNQLLRSLSYFPGADTTKQWLILGAWIVGGIVLTALGSLRRSTASPVAADAAER